LSRMLIEKIGVDLLLLNGKVITVDANDTVTEAVAVKDGKILMTGPSHEISALACSKTRKVDLQGKTLLPGFIDTHEHCIERALQKDWVFCGSPAVESLDDMVDALANKAATKAAGEWVIGYWFDESKWDTGQFPTRYDLDQATTKHPIFVLRAGGHNAVTNSLALQTVGIDKHSEDPDGGHIERDANRKPTGRLDEMAAMDLVRGKIPEPRCQDEESAEIMVHYWPEVEAELLSWGLTTIHEAHIKASQARAYQALLAAGKLRIRTGLILDGMAPYEGHATSDLSRQGLQTGFGWGEMLYVTGIKLGTDGAMGSRTAALNDPYESEPENRGIMRVTGEELTDEMVRCHQAGLRVCTHAIGDRAIDMTLDAIEEAVKSKPWADHRHRIEHAGYVTPAQFERMKRLGVTVSASIGFCYPIGDSHYDALGAHRMKGYYPMRSFRDNGIVAAGNSDGFGTSWALTGIYGCVTRKTKDGRVLAEEERIPIMDAIRAYTINGAYLEGKEAEKGSIEPGKLADFVLLDRDITTTDPEEILKAVVLMTVVGGNVAYENESDT
jgi:predicted amidohydrolase YtcJ